LATQFLVSAIGTVSQRIEAQTPPTVRIGDAVSCVACTIEFRPVANLALPDSGADGRPSAVRIDSRGRYWLLRQDDVPAVFTPGGRFLQLLGRRGKGPGEFLDAYDVLSAPADSVAVVDGLARRVTVFDRELRLARQSTLPFAIRSPVVSSWPDSIVASGAYPTPESAGWPMHLMSLRNAEARVLRSFGTGAGELRPDGGMTTWHFLSPPVDGQLWAAWVYGYNVQHWTPAGKLLYAFERRPSWFSKPAASRLGSPEIRPDPFVSGIEQDAAGLLWVFIRVPSQRWKEAWPQVPKGTREVPSRNIAFDKLFDTLIEVIDPNAATVVARRTIARYIVSSLPGRKAAMLAASDDRDSSISVVAFSLIKPR
jgi:hypothetical protein